MESPGVAIEAADILNDEDVTEAAQDLATSEDPSVRSEAASLLVERRRRAVGTCQGPDCTNPIYGYASKRYCSERCNQRAWRARRRAQGYVFGHAGKVVALRDESGVVITLPGRKTEEQPTDE